MPIKNISFLKFLNKLIEKNKYSKLSITTDENNMINIKGIDFKKLKLRMKAVYGDKKTFKIFIPVYNKRDLDKFYDKKISRSQMRIDEIKLHSFFALEASIIFNDLYSKYKFSFYAQIAEYLENKTWLADSNNINEYKIDKTNLRNIRYNLKDYQEEFINDYYNIKNKNKLDGFILSFDQGLGKTLTSIALAECLNKDYIYIVCPNSLKENWAYEIKNYYFRYYNNEENWKNEVFVIGNNKYKITKYTRFFIVNQEAIPKIFPYVRTENTMLIVDESHNFRDMNSLRTKHLYQLKQKLNCNDVLMMSGTPIKGTPSEIAPALQMIDPLFTEDVARIYNTCFNVSDISASRIVKQRLSKVIYRRTKDQVLKLPEKNKINLKLKIKDGTPYLIKNVKADIIGLFKTYYLEELTKEKEYKDEFISLVYKYSSSSKEDLDKFLYLIDTYIKGGNDKNEMGIHELDDEFLNSYTKEFVLPNIHDFNIYKRTEFLSHKFLTMRKSCMGRAIGILPKYRSAMFIDLFDSNKDQIIKMISECEKKTIIFTSLLNVANHITEELNKSGINTVKIIGGTKDRMSIIDKFKNDDTIDVLVATTQTLSTGVTLIEASQMFFFGTPWRSADFEQACDRIYRIGQTHDVNIYTVLLDTGKEKNLSQRIDEIMTWSGEMFASILDDE